MNRKPLHVGLTARDFSAVGAGAVAVTAPRVMPWGQTVAYVESVEGTIVGFVTPVGTGASASTSDPAA